MPPSSAEPTAAPEPQTTSLTTSLATSRTTTRVPDQLAVDLRISLLRTARRLRAEKSVDELTDGQFSVLSQLFVQGPRTPGELAETEHVRPPSMTRTIAALADAGLVTRTDHPDDGRQVLIAVSDLGSRVVEETRERRAAWLSARLATLTEDERSTLAEAARILRTVTER